ncbi:MAG TPA: DUF3426 domain-containing protein [Woeseiaceae bacterium]|nr:DUF3426 domain-containing protein [Woeseiaceae bacterium]
MSASESAELLKTLDQLAGEDIELEDTGVEWRLRGDDDDAEGENDADASALLEFGDDTDDELLAVDFSSSEENFDSYVVIEARGDENADDSDGSVLEFGGIFDAGEKPALDVELDDAPRDAAADTSVNEIFNESVTKVDSALFDSAGESRIDELLDATPTPVDEFLTQTPNEVEESEVFDAASSNASAEIDQPEVFAAAPRSLADELRFDDNTGLPDDFDFDNLPPSTYEGEERRQTAAREAPAEVAHERVFEKEPERQTTDFSLADEDEWDELLDEVEPLAEPADDKISVVSASNDRAAATADTSIDDSEERMLADEPAPSSRDAESDDRVPLHAMSLAEELAALPDEAEDDADYEASSDVVLIDDDESPEADAAELPETAAAAEADIEAQDVTPDLDTQFGLQAETMGIDLSGIYTARPDFSRAESGAATNDEPDDAPVAESLAGLNDELSAAELEAAASESVEEPGAQKEADLDTEFDVTHLVPPATAGTRDVDPEPDDEMAGYDVALEPPADAFPESTGELEFELVKAQEMVDAGVEFNPELFVPPPTPEEQTVNMLIDQDLMRLAIPEDDGLSSTMILDGKKMKGQAESDGTKEARDKKADDYFATSGSTGFESIIMEGDYVRTALEQKRLAAEAEARSNAGTDDVSVLVQKNAGTDTPRAKAGRKFQYGLVAAVLALALGLAGQFVHQSRAELATIPAVAKAIGPIYRAAGAPVSPEWDVRGWRFEVTKGSTNTGGLVEPRVGNETGFGISEARGAGEAEAADNGLADIETGNEVLTIYSRIGNKSDKALPYPLISVSLTDRFEETIGSKVLEPADYLTGDFDARAMVEPGKNFSAVISVAAPSDDATGFKLNVCYRQSGGQLRCAFEDFR